ncbi:hypothetical protein EDC01DRAFT_729303 [Geopyxis carbonaria]|nr:hypothetical protein EDC01DRAFT_729303 [Geopyxis carbonaria]
MAITEIATMHLISPHTPDVLRKALVLLSEASTHPFDLYCSLASPSTLYLFGHWESLAHHESWLASKANQSLLIELAGKLQIESMYHSDVAHEILPLRPGATVTVARFWVKEESKEEWNGWGVGGWAMEKEQDKQWVGWKNGSWKEDVEKMAEEIGVEKMVVDVVREARSELEASQKETLSFTLG